jgi:hypothetical protein
MNETPTQKSLTQLSPEELLALRVFPNNLQAGKLYKITWLEKLSKTYDSAKPEYVRDLSVLYHGIISDEDVALNRIKYLPYNEVQRTNIEADDVVMFLGSIAKIEKQTGTRFPDIIISYKILHKGIVGYVNARGSKFFPSR